LIKREVSYPNFPFEAPKAYIDGGKIQKTDTPRVYSAWWWGEIGKNYTGFLPKDLEFSATQLLGGYKLSNEHKTDTRLQNDTFITAEMAQNTTGLVKLEIYAKSDTTIAITFDELLTDGYVDYGRMECVNILIFKLKGGKSYSLLTAEPYTFKYASIISIGGEADINTFGVIRTDFNENEITKRIKDTADEQIKRIYQAALQTFRQNTYDIYMDCPSRERAGWLCDSFFTSRVEHLMTGKSRVEHAFLSNFLMAGQYPRVPDGMLPMCYPADHIDGNFIPNWAMWYVLELEEYFNRFATGEKFYFDISQTGYRPVYYRGLSPMTKEVSKEYQPKFNITLFAQKAIVEPEDSYFAPTCACCQFCHIE
jgi:alpha-L-rhamnosidase